MNIFDKTTLFLRNNKGNILFLFVFFAFYCSSQTTFAAAAEGTEAAKNTNLEQILLDVVRGVIIGVLPFLGFLTSFVGIFLNPGWTNGTIFGFDVYLKTLWIFVSNIVYYIFAFIFVLIAFLNIIGKGENNYELKTAIPRFIVGVLMVPFSWFFVQFMLSITSILALGVLTMPYDTFRNNLFTDEKLASIQTCKQIVFGGKAGTGNQKVENKTPTGEVGKKSDESSLVPDVVCKKYSTLKDDLKENGSNLYSIMYIYSYGVMDISELTKLEAKEVKEWKTLPEVTLKLIVNLIFFIVYFILLAGLFLALFMRGLYIWLYTIFSPLFGLLYFFKKTDGIGSEVLKDLTNIKEFVKLAIVPVLVSAALSFGLLFIFIAGEGLRTNFGKGEESGVKVSNYMSLTDDGYTLNANGTTLTIAKNVSGTSKSILSKNVFGQFSGSIGSILLQFLGICILRLSLEAALKNSSITGKITEDIFAFGDSIGKLMKKGPSMIPILPVSGGLSAKGLSAAGSSFVSKIETNAQNPGSELGNRLAGGGDERTESIRKLGRQSYGGPNDIERGLIDLFKNIDENKISVDNKIISDALKQMGAPQKVIDKAKDATTLMSLGKALEEDKTYKDWSPAGRDGMTKLFGQSVNADEFMEKVKSIKSEGEQSKTKTSTSSKEDTKGATYNSDNKTIIINASGHTFEHKIDGSGKLTTDQLAKIPVELHTAYKDDKGKSNITDDFLEKTLHITDKDQRKSILDAIKDLNDNKESKK